MEKIHEVIVVNLIVILVNSYVAGQNLLPDGSPYFCVPPGICLGGIDPRILTPEDSEATVGEDLPTLIDKVFNEKILTDGTPTPGIATCPAGKLPCYAQGSMSSCGQSANKNVKDGLADPDAYPWLGYLAGPSGYLGVGSLLSPYHVLTAAHKVLAFNATPQQLTIYFGVNNPATLNEPPLKPNSTASKIYIHPAHNNSTLKNDIAVVRLLNPIGLLDTNRVNTVCIPSATATNTTFTAKPQPCLVSGWGQIQPNNTAVPTQLKQVNVNTTDIDTCEKGFSGKVDTSIYLDKVGEICAGGEAQKDACFQDGGAPLNCRTAENPAAFTVAGIVIWGKSCGQPGVYGVYTNVPTYRSWIVGVLTEPIP
ncbi:trypsin-3-like isoform X2 [Harmonia axyridis]|uniref:trypsin-3-like isoform X2 n=1 Tax=Harmonia axyridis TaxID=115357 RepID=UPI001E277A25|nr:trypsin-3-like isoform X2 [Harmonia axyridis]